MLFLESSALHEDRIQLIVFQINLLIPGSGQLWENMPPDDSWHSILKGHFIDPILVILAISYEGSISSVPCLFLFLFFFSEYYQILVPHPEVS